MWKLIGTCDACRKEISQIEVDESNKKFTEWMQVKHPNDNLEKARQLYWEIFCADHVGKAVDYWIARENLELTCFEETKRRIERHRNRFWMGGTTRPELKVVGNEGH